MARRTAHAAGSNSEKIRAELVALLENFEGELQRPQRLREKVLGLVPANHLMRNLGVSLFIQESARDRILAYLQKFVGKEITSDELAVVAGISDFARRIRELRTEFGWPIATGVTMTEESGMHLPPDSYVRLSTPDPSTTPNSLTHCQTQIPHALPTFSSIHPHTIPKPRVFS